MEIENVLTEEEIKKLAKWYEKGFERILLEQQETKEQKKGTTGV